jgi:hypothetical protein
VSQLSPTKTAQQGIYVFVPLTPGLFEPFVVAWLVIAGWMALFADSQLLADWLEKSAL